MLSHEIPHGPWKFISQDLFKHGGRWYAVTVDHYSDWFEVDLLNEDITASHVISVTKAHFARYGVPQKFLSDNGPQYTSQEFENFAKVYDFQLITRSPYYARATGKAESAVKEAKKMLKKSDLLTGLLDHRNTPPQEQPEAVDGDRLTGENSAENPEPNPSSESPMESPVQTSRYGRTIRPPKRLDL
ncbi:hypothetical protein ACROYT_G025231 [Oculina patagonica]